MAYEGEEIRVTEDYDGEKDNLRLRWQVKGRRLLVKFCRTSVWGLDASSKNLTVEIPQSMADQLDRLKISSVSADQRVLVSARELEIHTVSGRADLQGQYNSVEIGTVSGDVSLDGIFCEGSIEGVSGDVEIRLREQAEELEMSFVSGKARVTLPETTTGFRVDFETVSGDSEVRGFDWDDDDSDRWGDGSMEISMNGVSGRLTIEKETKN